MLPKKHRLIARKDFASVYARGIYRTDNGISVKYIQNGLKNARIGFAIGKSYSQKATERNRMKRVLRSICLANLDVISSGFDIVLMAKPSDKNPSVSEYAPVLKRLLKKSGLLK